jgi:tetratricopeptide (TPR) repeat protein
LTESGALIGTPAYMAPEQFHRAPVDARTDQFAFCLALYEALYGTHPFAGESRKALRENVTNGRFAHAPRVRGVPGWLRSVIVRGLAVDSAARWPSMDAMLAALERGERGVRTRRWLTVAGFVVLAAAGGVAWRQASTARALADCEREGGVVDELWNVERSARVREAIIATGISGADAVAELTIREIDGYATAWHHARTESCTDTLVRGSWDADLLDRSNWCLDDARFQLEAQVEQLMDVGVDDVVGLPVSVSVVLPTVDACRNRALLLRSPVPRVEDRDAVDLVRRRLARAARVREEDDGLEAARGLLREAESLKWAPLVPAVRIQLASQLNRAGEYREAESELETAYFEAMSAAAPELAAAAAAFLTRIVGTKLARHAEGLRWARHAHAALIAAGAPPDDLRFAALLDHEGNLRYDMAEHAAAAALHEQALAIREAALGADNPGLAGSLHNLGNIRLSTGDTAGAKALNERALQIHLRAYKTARSDLAATYLEGIASAEFYSGDYPGAASHFEEVLRIREDTLGPNHRSVAAALSNLAGVRAEERNWTEAAALLERAIAIREELGSDAPAIAPLLVNLGQLLEHTGDLARARGAFERSLAIDEATLGADHPAVSAPLLGLSRVALAEHRVSDARASAERALSVREAGNSPSFDVADAEFTLARALWDAREPDRARALARAALDHWRESGEPSESGREVEAWLASHRPP